MLLNVESGRSQTWVVVKVAAYKSRQRNRMVSCIKTDGHGPKWTSFSIEDYQSLKTLKLTVQFVIKKRIKKSVKALSVFNDIYFCMKKIFPRSSEIHISYSSTIPNFDRNRISRGCHDHLRKRFELLHFRSFH